MKGGELDRILYFAGLSVGSWLSEADATLDLLADASALEACGVVVCPEYASEAAVSSADDAFVVEQDDLASVIDTFAWAQVRHAASRPCFTTPKLV